MVLTYKKILSQWIKETGYIKEGEAICNKCKESYYKSDIKEHQNSESCQNNNGKTAARGPNITNKQI